MQKQKRLVPLVTIVIVVVVGIGVFALRHHSSDKSAAIHTDLSWDEANSLLLNCKVKGIINGGGVAADNTSSADEGLVYLYLNTGGRKIARLRNDKEQELEIQTAKQKCGISELSP